ncbi:methyltransferase domain-containing protein [Thermoleophilia bacterium SCSIO 60948]|nr:methyltransferase domain-containing protein [Thermoleophilia bacterium SCSIO 60948]
MFARFMAYFAERVEERRGGRERRERMLAGLTGEVCEVGPGSGVSFRSYPSAVTRLHAVEPEAHMRELSRRAAEKVAIEVEVIDALGDDLPFADSSLDGVVFPAVLCSIPEPAAALAEARRVLRPGGTLRFFEHVVSPRASGRAIQRAAKETLWPRVFGGCDPMRDTEAAIRGAGFEIDWIERFTFVAAPVSIPVAPHILGAARKPA